MKLEINLDLEAAIASALSPVKLAPILDKHIAEAVTSAVRDVTGYNSEFSKALKVQLAGALPHGLALDDVAKFQQVLNHSLADLVNGMNSDAIKTALRKVAAEALPDVPAVVKLSELLEQARDGFHKEERDAFYAFWEPSRHGDGGGWLYLHGDPEPGSSSIYGGSGRSRDATKYSARYQLAVNGNGEVYALKLDGREITPAARPDVIGHFDAVFMSMYVGRTRLEIDMDDDEVEAAAAEKFD